MIRFISSLVAVLTVVSVQSQTPLREIPKLVVGITIDQLRGDYIELFQHSFGERGFKRVLNEGLVYQNMQFGFPKLNEASSIATIYTGTIPYNHGITEGKKYLADKSAVVSVFDDEKYLGNYTKEKLSPLALKVSTITDELKSASNGYSHIYSLAPNSFQALASGGHFANGAYWIEDFSGKWATTTYYKDFYWAVEAENRTGVFSNQTPSLIWQASLSTDKYNNFPYISEPKFFKHQFIGNKAFQLLKKTPYINDNVTRAASILLQKDELGKRNSPDFLALTYYAGNYPLAENGDYSIEIQDIYAQLDNQLAILFDEIDKTVGLKNTLIFITSTGYFDSVNNYATEPKQIGIFYSNRCEALLNMYLMAIYGKEQWVEKYHNQQIYLNRKLIQSKNIDIKEIQNKAVEFIVQFTGVQDAVSLSQLLTGQATSNMLVYRDIIDRNNSGDIILDIQPGYQIIDETNLDAKTSKIERENAIVCPVIFFGSGVKPQRIRRSIKATEIAPTICHILRIRSPNAAKEQPLPEFY